MYDDPEYLALLDTVLAKPEDDAPRWIISDWLEEHDQLLLANFIRFQLETDAEFLRDAILMASDVCIVTEEVSQLNARLSDFWKETSSPNGLNSLLRASMPESLAFEFSASPTCKNWTGATASVERGFVSSISLTMSTFMEHATELFRYNPIDRVYITNKTPGIADDSISNRYGWIYSQSWANPGQPYSLPKEIFDCLPKSLIYTPPTAMPRWSDIYKASVALETACVKYGRKLAGLSPLNFNARRFYISANQPDEYDW